MLRPTTKAKQRGDAWRSDAVERLSYANSVEQGDEMIEIADVDVERRMQCRLRARAEKRWW